MTNKLEHLDCPERIATEIHRVLRNNGIAFVTVPDIWKHKFEFWNDITHKRPFTDNSLRFLFETHGMETLELSPYNHHLFVAGHLIPESFYRRLARFRANSLLYIGTKKAARFTIAPARWYRRLPNKSAIIARKLT